ncbi:uncharacterized protein LOC129952639 [Eupeodes corollae]|uniref:uncharacterized protein LOC129952639 n=1 Tax=Eupeodes corollae TaxID=290404 RepID=UPI00248F81CF|nr:uncharacterized protein LOC129952639 [Eupeodes corollae]
MVFIISQVNLSEMNSFNGIDSKSNIDFQSVSNCSSNGEDQKEYCPILEGNFEIEQLSFIDLTQDECISPVKKQNSTTSPSDIKKNKRIFKRKNAMLSKPDNNSISPSTFVKKSNGTNLKQTQLNTFFCSAKKLPRRSEVSQSNKIYSQFKNNDHAMKPKIVDLCECLNMKTNNIAIKTLTECLGCKEMDNQSFQTITCDKEIDININLEYSKKEKLQTLLKEEIVDLCLDSSSEVEDIEKDKRKTHRKTKKRSNKKLSKLIKETESRFSDETHTACELEKMQITKDCILSSKTLHLNDDKKCNKESPPRRKRPGTVDSEKNDCPPYKVIEGTTFAVDAFNFGLLKNVTTYFLTHFHTDHYVGLTKKFSMPIYASETTINLIRGFIAVDEKLLHILFLNTPHKIEGVSVTAIDANHCPGAIMLLFQLPCGKRILHTGDFRWSQKMELDINLNLKQNHIDLLYLDTTHISDRHNINSQAECISKAINWVREFKQSNEGKKILYVVCTDVIGKENFWFSIADAFDLKIWSDGKRKKALTLIGNEKILKKLVSNANEADMHVVSHADAGFRHLDEYFHKFSDTFDMVLSIKPKGTDTIDPKYDGPVNSVSVRYSEHSTHKELRKFLSFLLPKRVISTVPLGKNIFRCPKIPVSWHTKEILVTYTKQVSLLNYVSVKKK